MTQIHQIVKIQKPLFTAEPNPSALAYGVGHSHEQSIPMSSLPPHVIFALRSVDKAYFRATWSRVSGWAIGERVADQRW